MIGVSQLTERMGALTVEATPSDHESAEPPFWTVGWRVTAALWFAQIRPFRAG